MYALTMQCNLTNRNRDKSLLSVSKLLINYYDTKVILNSHKEIMSVIQT